MATDTKDKGQPPTAQPPAGASALREVQREMHQLQERVEQLTQNAAPPAPPPLPPAPPPAVYSDPDHGPSTPPPHPLQDILPEIKDLAQRVGGMKKLAEIVTTLAETKE